MYVAVTMLSNQLPCHRVMGKTGVPSKREPKVTVWEPMGSCCCVDSGAITGPSVCVTTLEERFGEWFVLRVILGPQRSPSAS